MYKIVTARGLNFRKQPKIADNIISVLPMGSKLKVSNSESKNGYIDCYSEDGTYGFVYESHLRHIVSDEREHLVKNAIDQWKLFDYGKGKEYVKPFSQYVGKMWQAIGLSLDGEDTDVPWSAAAISYIVRLSGKEYPKYLNFKFSAAHAKYCYDSIERRLKNDYSSPFWGYRVTDRKPQIGDIICRSRAESGVDFEYASTHNAFKSHCDIIIDINSDFALAIGGNVSDSMNMTKYALTDNGYLSNGKGVYALLSNNVSDRIESLTSGNICGHVGNVTAGNLTPNNTLQSVIKQSESLKLKLKARYFHTDSPMAYMNEVRRPDGSKEVQLIGDWDEEIT